MLITSPPVCSRQMGNPKPGEFKMRATKNGPWLAAQIKRVCMCTIGGSVLHDHTPDCDRPGSLTAELNGRSHPVEDVWMYGRPITRPEYDRLSGCDPQPLSSQSPAF